MVVLLILRCYVDAPFESEPVSILIVEVLLMVFQTDRKHSKFRERVELVALRYTVVVEIDP